MCAYGLYQNEGLLRLQAVTCTVQSSILPGKLYALKMLLLHKFYDVLNGGTSNKSDTWSSVVAEPLVVCLRVCDII